MQNENSLERKGDKTISEVIQVVHDHLGLHRPAAGQRTFSRRVLGPKFLRGSSTDCKLHTIELLTKFVQILSVKAHSKFQMQFRT